MTELVGQNLGQYQILSEIAKGGMATVYLARQTSLGRDVAIKVLPPNFMHDDTFLARFSREVDVIAKLQHPHIMPVYDYGEFDGLPYIVSAYLNGGTLMDVIQDAPLPSTDILHLVKQMADALDFAHSKDIVHRDLKPANVLMDEQGNTYLADFGLARISASSSELTGNTIVGTPTYMAPEQSGPGEISPATDVYALGVTIFQMLTGNAPYEDASATVVLMAHLTQPIPNIHDYRADLPAAVHAVIMRAMAKEAPDRYASAGQLYQDLESALLEKGVSSIMTETQEILQSLLMTNMLGQVIFVDGQCLKMLKRHHNEARLIIGQPLADVLGADAGIVNQIINELATSGNVVDTDITITDAQGKHLPILLSATPTKDNDGEFVGADISLKRILDADEPLTDSFQTSEQHLSTREETVLQSYFASHVDALYDLMSQWAGPRAGKNLEDIINETAARNVWTVSMIDGHVTVQFNKSDADIYRALMAKAVAYAANIIGANMVRKEIEAVDNQMDDHVVQFADQLGLRTIFDELL